jgi:hypothetical protein
MVAKSVGGVGAQELRGSIFQISGQPQTGQNQFLSINLNAMRMLAAESLTCKVYEMLHLAGSS